MPISIVSTLHSHCGIAKYTGYLVRALRDSGADVETIAEETWRANTLSYPLNIFSRIIRSNSQLVHIQHEYLLFGKGEYGALLIPLLAMLRASHRTVILTLHSVIPMESLSANFFEEYTRRKTLVTFKKFGVLTVTKLLAMLSNRVIVHTQSAREILVREYNVPARKITVIAHPTATRHFYNPRRQSVAKLVLFTGFVKPSKGIDSLIQAIKTVSVNLPDVQLLVAGEISNHHSASSEYANRLQHLAQKLGVSQIVKLDFRYVPENELDEIISSASVVVLPYRDQVCGESGVLWRVASFGKPVIVSDVPKFAGVLEDYETALFFPPGDSTSLAACIKILLTNHGLAERIGANLRNLALGNTWAAAAQKTSMVYASESKVCVEIDDKARYALIETIRDVGIYRNRIHFKALPAVTALPRVQNLSPIEEEKENAQGLSPIAE
jgi:glycosyltransferase involved in cell wall biosynthesis